MEEAYDDLQKGNAFVVAQVEPDGPLEITDVSLGYYMGLQNQEYFVPIVVFQGGTFKGYVNALKSQ
jgi:hypothetical protein